MIGAIERRWETEKKTPAWQEKRKKWVMMGRSVVERCGGGRDSGDGSAQVRLGSRQ